MKSINNRFIDHPAKKNDKGVSVSVLCTMKNKKESELSKNNIIHIKKTTSEKSQYHYFWNNRTKEIIKGSGCFKNIKKIPSIIKHVKYKKDTCDLNRMEIQIGDFICYLFDTKVAPLLFGRITGFDKTSEGIYFHILPNHPDFPFSKGVAIKAKYQKSKFFLISNGVNEREDEIVFSSNKVYAIFKSELTFAENLFSIINGRPFAYSFLSDKDKPLGEIAFKECHKALFGSIYSWAGNYRKNEVVVGDKNCETLHFDFIHNAIKKCLRRCNRTSLSLIKNREDIIIFLTNLHKELAWIHPFIDGNGRAIRLYLQIISLTLGFNFKINTLCNSTGAKRRYHYAVKLSISGNNKYLMALFDRAIEPI